MNDLAYRCGLPVAMGMLAIGSLALLAGSGVLVVAATQALLGIGPAGRLARAHGVLVRLR